MNRLLAFLAAVLGLDLTSLTRESVAGLRPRLSVADRVIADVLANEELSDDDRAEALRALGRDPEQPWERLSAEDEGAPGTAPGTGPGSAGGQNGRGRDDPARGGQTQGLSNTGATNPYPNGQNGGAPNVNGNPPAGGNGSGASASGGTALTQADVDARVLEAQQREAQRQGTIHHYAQLSADRGITGFDADALRGNPRIDEAGVRDAFLQAYESAAPPMAGSRVSVGRDNNLDTLGAAVHDAICLQIDVPLYQEARPTRVGESPVFLRAADGGYAQRQPHERAREFEYLSVQELSRRFLACLGVPATDTMHPREVFNLVTDRTRLAGHVGNLSFLNHSTSDFPGIFANVLNKMLLPAYEAAPHTSDAFTVVRPVKDFKAVNFNKITPTTLLARVPEGAEYEYGTLAEASDTGQVFKFGLLIAFTWEAFINDDLNAFNESALGFAETARYLEEDEYWKTFLGNPELGEDSTALFHADHSNLQSAAAFGQAALTVMKTAMAKQTTLSPGRGEGGRVLSITPTVLLVPPELEPAASQLIESFVDVTKSNNTPNLRYIRNLGLVSEPRLSLGVAGVSGSTTAYYLATTNRRTVPASWRLRAKFHPNPMIEQINTGGSVDGMTYKCRHVFGQKFTEFRGWQKNPGS